MSLSKKELENEHQKAWEEWYYRVSPHGDCTDVQNQWLESCDYEDFCSEHPEWDEQ